MTDTLIAEERPRLQPETSADGYVKQGCVIALVRDTWHKLTLCSFLLIDSTFYGTTCLPCNCSWFSVGGQKDNAIGPPCC